jgi:hypothetical protein
MPNGWEVTAAIASILAVLVAASFGYAQMRAEVSIHMGLGGTGVPLRWAPGEPYQSFVYVFNDGKSPAYNLRFRGWCKEMTLGELCSIDAFADGRPNPDNEGSQTLYCGVHVALYRSVKSDAVAGGANTTAVFGAGDRRLYVFGTIEYDDFMSFHHERNFCVYYTTSSPTGYHWVECDLHNESN